MCPAGGTSASQAPVSPSGLVPGLIRSPPDYPVRNGGHYVLAYLNGSQVNGIAYVDADGTYTFPGLAAGTYQMRLTAYHNQGTNLQGSVDNVVVTVGTTTTADLP